MITRIQYITTLRTEGEDTERAYRQYHAQFVTPALKQFVAKTIGMQAIVESKDPLFIEVHREKWESMHETITNMSEQIMHETGQHASLSFSVCVAKEAADQLRDSFQYANKLLEGFHEGTVGIRDAEPTNQCVYAPTCPASVITIRMSLDAAVELRRLVQSTGLSSSVHKEIWRAICGADSE